MKIINFRLSLVLCVAVIAGVISFHEFLFGNVWVVALCVGLPAVAAVPCIIFKKKWWKALLVFTLFVAIGFADFVAVYHARGEDGFTSSKVTLTGRVTDIGRNGNAQNVLYIEDCRTEGGILQGRVKVYVYDGEQFFTGQMITAEGQLEQVYAVQDRVDTLSVRNGVRYELRDVSILNTQEGELTLAEKVRRYVYDVTAEYMPKNADVAYALLTGDRNAMEQSKEQAFTSAGIIHLLVVSGLHVGFVVTVFGFLLRLLRLPVIVQLIILLFPLCFYGYVCDFAPSVQRAVIMAVCTYLCKIVRGRYDLLSSLCWAAVIILLFQPMYLFDVGFQLSAFSVFGIATVLRPISRALKESKMPKPINKLLSSLAVSFSCVAATFFVSAYYFGEVSVQGIFTNLIAIPLVMVSFIACMAGMLPWIFRYLLVASDLLLQVVTRSAEFVESLQMVASVSAIAAGMAVSVPVLLAVGGYINVQKFKKPFYVCASLILVLCVVAALPQRQKEGVKVFVGYEDNVVVASHGGHTALVGNFCDEYVTSYALQYAQRQGGEVTLYICSFSEAGVQAVKEVCSSCKVRAAYVLDGSGNDVLEDYFSNVGITLTRVFPNSQVGKGVSVQAVYDGSLCAAVVTAGDITVANVVAEGVAAQNFPSLRSDLDFCVINGSADSYAERGICTITHYQQSANGNFGANKYGNFTITQKDGKISLSFRSDR